MEVLLSLKHINLNRPLSVAVPFLRLTKSCELHSDKLNGII